LSYACERQKRQRAQAQFNKAEQKARESNSIFEEMRRKSEANFANMARLRALRVSVKEAGPLERYDFLLNGKVRVALRAAFPSSYRRRVRLRHRQYSYVYRAWNFNFHHRGRIDERYCDFFVCVPLGAGRVDLRHAYVIPWEARTGKTFYLPDSQRPYSGKYVRHRNAWDDLRRSVQRGTSRAHRPGNEIARESA